MFPPLGSIESGADPVAVVIVGPLGASASAARRSTPAAARHNSPDGVAAEPMSAPEPAPIAAPARAPPALPPDTAEPIRAPVPAPSAPPTSAFCCCGVSQPETDTAASERRRKRQNSSHAIQSPRPSRPRGLQSCLHSACNPRGQSEAARVAIVRRPRQSHNSREASMNEPGHWFPRSWALPIELDRGRFGPLWPRPPVGRTAAV